MARRRKASRRRRRSSSRRRTVAIRTNPPFRTRRVRRGRRRGSRGGLGRIAGGFVPAGSLMAAGSALGGFVGAHFIVNQAVQRLNMTQIAAGNARIAAKAAAGLLGAFVLRRFLKVSPSIANGFAVGAMVSAGADLWNKFSGRPLAGLGVIEIDGMDSYPGYGDMQLGQGDDELGNYAVAGSLPMDA